MEFRSAFGDLNSFILDSLRGLDETIQYGQGERRRRQMEERSDSLGALQKNLNRLEASQKSVTNLVILLFSLAMLLLMIVTKQAGEADLVGMVIATIAMMGSFGPVTALSNLSNNLNQTLAAGERVLSILEEEPQVEEVSAKRWREPPQSIKGYIIDPDSIDAGTSPVSGMPYLFYRLLKLPPSPHAMTPDGRLLRDDDAEKWLRQQNAAEVRRKFHTEKRRC